MEEIKNINSVNNVPYNEAVQIIKTAILQSRTKAVSFVNKEILSLYYNIGEYVSLNSRNGYWGQGAIEYISMHLQKELPGLRGFSATNIRLMRIFYEEWCYEISKSPVTIGDFETADNKATTIRQLQLTNYDEMMLSNSSVVTDEFESTDNKAIIIRQLQLMNYDEMMISNFFQIGFTHHSLILANIKEVPERLFYIKTCAQNGWTVETLKFHIKEDLFKKLGGIPNNFKQTLSTEDFRKKAILAFKDEYLLDFVNIEDPELFDERMLEKDIVANISKFIIHTGSKFCFIGNQYRLIVLEKEIFIDLLFFNRTLNCLVAIELKRGAFRPEYLGQLHLYLQALDDKERQHGENPSIGILLCKEADKAFAEYAVRDYNKPMGVATYLTHNEMPDDLRKNLPDIDDLKKLL